MGLCPTCSPFFSLGIPFSVAPLPPPPPPWLPLTPPPTPSFFPDSFPQPNGAGRVCGPAPPPLPPWPSLTLSPLSWLPITPSLPLPLPLPFSLTGYLSPMVLVECVDLRPPHSTPPSLGSPPHLPTLSVLARLPEPGGAGRVCGPATHLGGPGRRSAVVLHGAHGAVRSGTFGLAGGRGDVVQSHFTENRVELYVCHPAVRSLSMCIPTLILPDSLTLHIMYLYTGQACAL